MKRPNVLILYTDQQRWDALGANGNPDIKTPNFDRLAAEGVNFDHHFVQNPVCMPSRASFLTGQYPSTLGITHMGVPVPMATVTLPTLLKQYGYRSGNIGKLHFLPHANRDHREPHPAYGFDCLEISDEPGCYEDAYYAWVRAKSPDQLTNISVGLPPNAKVWRETMRIDDPVVHPEERFPKQPIPFGADDELTHTAFVADQSMAFIDRQAGPWCCIAGFYSPHSPWVAPQRFLDVYDPEQLSLIPDLTGAADAEADSKSRDSLDRATNEAEIRAAHHGYYAMVSEVDHHVGRILDHLDTIGQAEETIVVFTSDHGEWLGEHGRYGKGYPGDDSVSRVPLVIRWPASIGTTGRRESRIVEAVDVLSTLLDCAAIQVPPHLQGTSLLRLLRGEASTESDIGCALMEHRGWKTLRTRRFRYLVEAGGAEKLFDLDEDPKEYRDVSGHPRYAAHLADMRHRLLQRLIETERALPRTWTY